MAQPRHIESFVHDGRIGVLVEVQFEDSMLAGVDDFRSFTRDLAMHIAAANPASVEDLLRQGFVKNPSITVKKEIQRHILKFGENIEVTRFTRWDTQPTSPNDGHDPRKKPAVELRVVK